MCPARVDLQQLGLFDSLEWNDRVDHWLVDHLALTELVSANDLFRAEQRDAGLMQSNSKKISAVWGRWVNCGYIERAYDLRPQKPLNRHNNGRRVPVYRRGPRFGELRASVREAA